MVSFWRWHGGVGGGAIFDALGNAEVVLQDVAVAEMPIPVTFGDPVFGRQINHLCDRQNTLRFPHSQRHVSAK